MLEAEGSVNYYSYNSIAEVNMAKSHLHSHLVKKCVISSAKYVVEKVVESVLIVIRKRFLGASCNEIPPNHLCNRWCQILGCCLGGIVRYGKNKSCTCR